MASYFGILFATCVTISSILGQNEDAKFGLYKAKFNKDYSEDVETLRYEYFQDNQQTIQYHNDLYSDGLVDFTMGTNQYSDMSHDEFSQVMLGYVPQEVTPSSPLYKAYKAAKSIKQAPYRGPLPASVDWRKKGWVSDIKDQGQCGSCFAFSACGAIEGAYAKKYGKLIDCSEQNLLDCTYRNKYMNMGCNGGQMWTTYQYVKENKGMEAEETYNYFAEYTGECQYAPADKKIALSGYVFVPKTEAALQAAVAVQPISIGIDASAPSFQYYKSGIYYEPACNSTRLNHAVLLVGYGRDASDKAFWIIKNSWGSSWGENGYMRIARNLKNHCGVATDASYPIVA